MKYVVYTLISVAIIIGCAQTDRFVPVAGKDGVNGADGQDGSDGANGADGVAGQSGLPSGCVTSIQGHTLYFTCPQGIGRIHLRRDNDRDEDHSNCRHGHRDRD